MKVVVRILLGVLLTLVLALSFAVLWLDPNDFRDDIGARFAAATGHDLLIGGDLRLSFFPWIGFEANDVSVDDVAGGGEEPLAQFDELQVRARLIPLLVGGPVEVRLSGTLAGPVSIVRARFALEATIAPRDVPGEFTLSPAILHLEELNTAHGPSIRGELTADVTADLSARRYLASGLSSRLDLTGGPLGQAGLPVAIRGDLWLDLAAETLNVRGLSVRSGELRLSAEAQGSSLFGDPVFDGRLQVAGFDLRTWLSERQLGALPRSDPSTLRRVALTSRWRAGAGRVDLNGLALTIDQTRVVGQVSVLRGDPTGYRFELEADRIDLDRYLFAKAEPRGTDGQPAASIPAPSELGVPAKAELRDPVGQNATSFPPPREQGLPAKASESGSVPAPTQEPPASLRTLEGIPERDLDGHLKAGELRVARLNLGDADLRVTGKRGRIRVENQVGRFYQGQMAGHLELFADETPPRLRLVQRATAVQAGPLLSDLTGEDRLQGSANIDADLDTSGRSEQELKRNLGGRLTVEFADGAVSGFNLEHMIRDAEARFKGKPVPAVQPLQTRFTELHASVTVAGGVLTNQDLRATSDYLHVTGEGKVDIAGERFDYRFAPRFVDPPEGRGIKEIEDIPIPIRLTGSFAQPDWNVDLGPVLRELARRKLGRELDAEDGGRLKELEERTGIKGLEQGLQRLLGR